MLLLYKEKKHKSENDAENTFSETNRMLIISRL